MVLVKREKNLQFAKQNGYNDVIYLAKWRGFDCYEPVFSDSGEFSIIGLPLMIMVKGETIRMSTPEESLQQIDEILD